MEILNLENNSIINKLNEDNIIIKLKMNSFLIFINITIIIGW